LVLVCPLSRLVILIAMIDGGVMMENWLWGLLVCETFPDCKFAQSSNNVTDTWHAWFTWALHAQPHHLPPNTPANPLPSILQTLSLPRWPPPVTGSAPCLRSLHLTARRTTPSQEHPDKPFQNLFRQHKEQDPPPGRQLALPTTVFRWLAGPHLQGCSTD
jgi:hypothetical protein